MVRHAESAAVHKVFIAFFKGLHMKPWIVIAAYNEAEQIGAVVEDLRKAQYRQIIVIDDGSNDATEARACSAGAVVFRHMINRGQGAALKTGIDAALRLGAEHIVTFDADGQHDPADIADLLQTIRSGKYDVVLGSRFLSKRSAVPWSKRIILRGGILFTWIFSGVHLTDAHNGLRAFSRSAAQQITIRQDRMEHASEIIDEIKRHGLRYCEVPVTIKYSAYSLQHGQRPLNSLRIAATLLFRKLTR